MTEPDDLSGDEPDGDDDTVFEQLDEEDTLADPDVPDPLDEGISPNEQPVGTTAWGVTEAEERIGQPLDHGLVELGVLARGDELDRFAQIARKIVHQPAEAAEQRSDRHHADLRARRPACPGARA